MEHVSLSERLKRRVRSMLGLAWFPPMDLQIPTARLGSEYGGWVVAPALLGRGSIVYSAGIGEDISFDLEMIRKFGVTVHAFDPTPRSLEWVRAQNPPSQLVVHPWGLAAFDGIARFHPPDDPAHISHTLLSRPSTADRAIDVPMRTVSATMAELGHDRIDLLKLDIEGAEYDVIDDLLRAGVRPAQIFIEFHHRFEGLGMGRTRATVAQLRSSGYGIFDISHSGQEFSFVLKSVLRSM